ncbi:MAG: bifunctional heptose 7-phosphate kinase/heptose 1-phosphate adenyltransferase [Puniceicoccaceae bacterium]
MKVGELLKRIRGRRVLVVGDIMLDHYVWGDASRISPEAPVPVVDVTKDSFAAGGAANVALNLAALGAVPLLAGRTGEDEGGERIEGLLAAAGVERLPGFRSAGCPTIRKTRVMVRNQQLCRIDREASCEAYRIDSEKALAGLSAAIDTVDAILLSDYGKGAVSGALIARMSDAGRSRGIPVALDPKPRRDLRFEGIDLLTPNRAEALELAGLPSGGSGGFPAGEVCRRIRDRYRPRHLVVTLGGDGILLSGGGGADRVIPTCARQVFDVSGAGDTVIAALVLALTAGVDLSLAARLANLAAGVVVGKVGTATASGAEILDYLALHPDLADAGDGFPES